jgi:hypothetical protein
MEEKCTKEDQTKDITQAADKFSALNYAPKEYNDILLCVKTIRLQLTNHSSVTMIPMLWR